MATYSELEQLMLDRWSDVQALTEAFESLHDIMGRHLEKAAETLRPWLRQNGYELEVDKKYADLKAFRAGWTGQDGEPFVHLVFGGIYPAGYRRVESKSPYEWVYAQGISDARRPEFGVELRAAMGNTADEWQDPDVNDDQPTGRYLTQYTGYSLPCVRPPSVVGRIRIRSICFLPSA